MVEIKKVGENLREFLNKFRGVKFNGLNVYKKGETSNIEALKEIKNGSNGIKLLAFFKIIKNILPKGSFESKFMKDLKVIMDEDTYTFSGEVYKNGWEHLVYLLTSENSSSPKFVIKFQIDTISTKKSTEELNALSEDRKKLLEILKEAMEGIPNVEVPEKLYFACKNPFTNKLALAHLMDFIAFDGEVLDLFSENKKETNIEFLKQNPVLIETLRQIYINLTELFQSGIHIDISGPGNILMGIKNGIPCISFVDAETHLQDNSLENLSKKYALLKALLDEFQN
jgi:hypothetical protein